MHTAHVYFSGDIHFPSPLHTRLLLAYAWEAHHPPILKKAKGNCKFTTRCPEVVRVGNNDFFPRHNDNNCEHNTIRFGEMRNRIMQ